MYVMKMAHSV